MPETGCGRLGPPGHRAGPAWLGCRVQEARLTRWIRENPEDAAPAFGRAV